MSASLLVALVAVMLTSGLAALLYQSRRHDWVVKLNRHPLTLAFSLAVVCCPLLLLGSLTLAAETGFGYLGTFVGISGLFLLGSVLLRPIHQLSRRFQLRSLPDLISYRFQSQLAGSLTTLVCVAGSILLLELYLELARVLLAYLSPDFPPDLALLMLVFGSLSLALMVGQDDRDSAAQVLPMRPVLALCNGVALASLLALGAYLLWQLFGGFQGLEEWIQQDGRIDTAMSHQMEADPWRAMLLIFFAGALVWPPVYHLLFCEGSREADIRVTGWSFPMLMLLFSLPVPILIWSGVQLGIDASPAVLPVSVLEAQGQEALSLLLTVVLLSGGVGLFALTQRSLSGMTLNHWLLPLVSPPRGRSLQSWVRLNRRILIVLLSAVTVLLVFLLPGLHPGDLLILAFCLLVQCFPGILAVLYWPQGNRQGYIAGLITGLAGWFWLMLLPSLSTEVIEAPNDWHVALLICLALNGIMFVVVSLLTPTRALETAAGRTCTSLGLQTEGSLLQAFSIREFEDRLAHLLGERTARRELYKAMHDCHVTPQERRTSRLLMLRDQLEQNLSGLIGPQRARRIISQSLEQGSSGMRNRYQDMLLLESRIEGSHARFTGMAAELDLLRRYHRQILRSLPLPACIVGANGEILQWNNSMVELTGIPAREACGYAVDALLPPWSELLLRLVNQPRGHLLKQEIELNGHLHWFNLHQSVLDIGDERPELAGRILLVEDCTETRKLESELIHTERLASIGRLAAGVAHEIGNPLTGIDCLAQNLTLFSGQDEDLHETARQIREQAARISRIVESLVNFSRSGIQGEQYWLSVSLFDCVAEAINLLVLSREAPRITFSNRVPRDAHTFGDSQRLLQVFINLLSNSRDACEDGAEVLIRGQLAEDCYVVSVEDPGKGIKAAHLQRVFEPFFTTKVPGKGTGLGMSLVYAIIEEHHGRITIESPLQPNGSGTRISLHLPAVSPVEKERRIANMETS